MKRKSGRKAAAIEAREEAGVTGRTLKHVAGRHRYWKRLDSGFIPIEVTVFLLAVENEQDAWLEANRRQRARLAPSDAATLIDEPQLAALITMLTVDQLALSD